MALKFSGWEEGLLEFMFDERLEGNEGIWWVMSILMQEHLGPWDRNIVGVFKKEQGTIKSRRKFLLKNKGKSKEAGWLKHT